MDRWIKSNHGLGEIIPPNCNTITLNTKDLSPLTEAESELSHDTFDDRQFDDSWWNERRNHYVQLYRLAAQLNVRSYLMLPPARADEQGTVELEGQGLARLPRPHYRWCHHDGREDDVVSRAREYCVSWPPCELLGMLVEAEDSAVKGWPCKWRLQPTDRSSLRFEIGERVEVFVEETRYWHRGIVVWRNYIVNGHCHPYILLWEAEFGTTNEQECKLILAEADHDCCIRRVSDESLVSFSKGGHEDQINAILRLLFQAWWIMPCGYDVLDICRDLSDMEIAEGLKVAHRMASSHCEIINELDLRKMQDYLRTSVGVEESLAMVKPDVYYCAPDTRPKFTKTQLESAWDNMGNDKFDSTLPGGALANLLNSLSNGKWMPLRDGLTCATCGKESKEKVFNACGRCQMVSYCSKLCQTSHWSVHKQSCKNQKHRINELEQELKCNRQMIKKALHAVNEHTDAARVLCRSLLNPIHLSLGYSDQKLCDALNLLFQVELTPSRLKRIAKTDEQVASDLKASRTRYNTEAADKQKAMEPIKKCCCDIYKTLIGILPALGLYRRHSAAPQRTNRELVDDAYGKIENSYTDIPFFLQIVDNCLSTPSILPPEFCRVQPKQMQKIMRKVKTLVYTCWVNFTRVFEGSEMDNESDEEIVELSRQRWYLSFYHQRRVEFGEDWMKQPGIWIPWHIVPEDHMPDSTI